MSNKKTTETATIITVPDNIKSIMLAKVKVLSELEARHKLINGELVEVAKTFLMSKEIEFDGFDFDENLNIKLK